MKGVLVTGATTPFGLAMVRALLARSGIEAVLAVGIEREWAGPRDARLEYRTIDLTRSRDIHDLLFGAARDRGIDAILDTAHHRSLRARGRHAHALNVEATRELMRLSDWHPTIRRFVYVGSAEVYRIDSELPSIIDEDHPIEMSPKLPQRVRDRVEADFTVCARMGLSRLSIAVLRLSEMLAPHSGSQLADYLGSRVCFRPLGFDPMLDVISIEDAVRAAEAALVSRAQGVFNIPGADVLPLSRLIDRSGRVGVAVPGSAIGALYAARAAVRGTEFAWLMNRWRFRWSGVLDGSRARDELGYEVGSSRVDLQACKLEYSIVSPK